MNIKQLRETPISNQYILSKINTNIIGYSMLKNIVNIDDILYNDTCIILYETTNNDKVGHWVCLCKRNNTLSFFDSYGRIPDDIKYNVQEPYLSLLLYNSPYNLEYSEHNYQLQKNSATCGYHCIVRILFKNKSLAYYQKFMSQFNNQDDLVIAITNMI